MAVNSYLDQYKEYISQSYVVISDIGIELALSIEQGNLDSESLNSLLGYVLFSRNVIDIQATFDQRLDPLTAMVNQAPLLPVPIPLGYLGNINIYPPSIPPLLSHSQLLNVLGPGDLHIDDLLLNKLNSLPFNYGWDDIVGSNPLINIPLAAIIAGLEPAFPASGNPARYLNGTKVFSQVQFSHLGGVPTTLAGYGISSSDTLFDGRYLRANSVLSTYSLGSNTPINNTQSIVQMFGNVQAQINAREAALGNPSTNGYILSSTTAGVRSWVPFAGGGTLNTVSVNGLNGFAGTVGITAGNAAITLRTSVTGLLIGDGTAISPAIEMTDYIGITGASDGETIIYDGTSGVATWAPAFNNPMLDEGDLIIGGAFGATTRLPGNSTAVRKFLMSVSVFGVVQPQTYQSLIASDIPFIPISRVTNLQTALDRTLSDNLLRGRIFIGNPSDLAEGVVPSGDWTITTAGVATIGANKVTFNKFQQAGGPQRLVGTPNILGLQDFREITLDAATLQIDAFGMMSSIATGTGTVTNTNTLDLNYLVLGDGGTAIKVGGGFTTDGVSQLTLGVIGTSVGGLLLTNLTSGTVELRPVTGALGTTVLSLFAGSDTLVGLAATQTLTNKTLTNPRINGALLEITSTVGYVWTATNTTGAGSWQAATGGGGTTTNSLTINNSGTGDASGTTFNGSVARTISSNTILPSFTGNNGLYLRLSSTGLPEWASATGSGTVSSGNQYQLAYYAANGTTVSGLTLITASRALVSDANGLPIASTVSTTQLQYLASATGTTGTTSTNLVFSTSPTLVTPTLGAALATSINGLTITSTTGTLTLDNGSTLATSGAFSTTLTATATTTLTLPTTGTLATLAGTETFTNKTLNGPKIGTVGGQGHFHMHFANSAPTGLTDYITVFGDVAPTKKLGFLFELDAFESYFQFNATTASKTYTFPDLSGTVALNPMTDLGDIIYGGTVTSGVAAPTRLPIGTTGQVLTVSGGGLPTWTSLGSGVNDGNYGQVNVTSSGTVWTPVNLDGTNFANVAGPTVLANLTLGSGQPSFVTGTQLTTIIDTFVGTSGVATLKGLVPAPILVTDVGKFLRADGTWQTVSGSGDMVLATPQRNTGAKTFAPASLIVQQGGVGTFGTILASNVTGSNKTATFPDASGTVAFLTIPQTWTTSLQTFSNNTLGFRNAANTATTTISGGSSAADYTLTIPTLTASSFFAVLNVSQTFTARQAITINDNANYASVLALNNTNTGTGVQLGLNITLSGTGVKIGVATGYDTITTWGNFTNNYSYIQYTTASSFIISSSQTSGLAMNFRNGYYHNNANLVLTNIPTRAASNYYFTHFIDIFSEVGTAITIASPTNPIYTHYTKISINGGAGAANSRVTAVNPYVGSMMEVYVPVASFAVVQTGVRIGTAQYVQTVATNNTVQYGGLIGHWNEYVTATGSGTTSFTSLFQNAIWHQNSGATGTGDVVSLKIYRTVGTGTMLSKAGIYIDNQTTTTSITNPRTQTAFATVATFTNAPWSIFVENDKANFGGGILINPVATLATALTATAALEVVSTTKGVRFPNMTTAQKNAITNTAGLVIFDTDLAKLCVNSGSGWQTITSI
jgi:hypothetical protein